MSYHAKAAIAAFVITAAAVATVSGVGADEKHASAHSGEALSGSEIRALFPGRFEAVWKGKRQVSVKARGDGAISGAAGILSDSGQWSVRGDELCVSFYWWTGNKPRCTEVRRQGGWYIGMMRSNGEPRVRFRPQ